MCQLCVCCRHTSSHSCKCAHLVVERVLPDLLDVDQAAARLFRRQQHGDAPADAQLAAKAVAHRARQRVHVALAQVRDAHLGRVRLGACTCDAQLDHMRMLAAQMFYTSPMLRAQGTGRCAHTQKRIAPSVNAFRPEMHLSQKGRVGCANTSVATTTHAHTTTVLHDLIWNLGSKAGGWLAFAQP